MSKRIITIGRQCGSGGHTIGKRLAEQLGIPLYDKRLMEIVAARSGLSEQTIQQHGEYTTTSLLYNLATNISHGYHVDGKGNMVLPDQINAFQTELIRELADKEPCVIVGRCSNYILRDRADCLHVFIHGNVNDRKNRVVSEHSIASEDAESHIRDRDKKRARHHRHITDQIWGMAENYHLCLDSSEFGVDAIVDLIAIIYKR